MEPVFWLFGVLSEVFYWPFSVEVANITPIVALMIIVPIAAGALCMIIDWIFNVRDEFSQFNQLEDYDSRYTRSFIRYHFMRKRREDKRVDLAQLTEYQKKKYEMAREYDKEKSKAIAAAQDQSMKILKWKQGLNDDIKHTMDKQSQKMKMTKTVKTPSPTKAHPELDITVDDE